MIYSDSVKNHWLEQIEAHKDRFNPDCGNDLCTTDEWSGAPQHILVSQFGNVDQRVYEQEFQLPIWLINFMTSYYHEWCPQDSYKVIKEVFESVPTYTCLEPARHQLSIKWLSRLQLECGLQFSANYNRCANGGRPYFLSECVGTAISEHQRCIQDPKHTYDIEYAMSGTDKIKRDVFNFLQNTDDSGANMVHCIANKWLHCAPEYYIKTHLLVGTKSTGECWDTLYKDLIEVLKDANKDYT